MLTRPGFSFTPTVSTWPTGMSVAANCATCEESRSDRAQSPFDPAAATEQNTSWAPPGTVIAAVAEVIRGIDDPVRSQYNSS